MVSAMQEDGRRDVVEQELLEIGNSRLHAPSRAHPFTPMARTATCAHYPSCASHPRSHPTSTPLQPQYQPPLSHSRPCLSINGPSAMPHTCLPASVPPPRLTVRPFWTIQYTGTLLFSYEYMDRSSPHSALLCSIAQPFSDRNYP